MRLCVCVFLEMWSESERKHTCGAAVESHSDGGGCCDNDKHNCNGDEHDLMCHQDCKDEIAGNNEEDEEDEEEDEEDDEGDEEDEDDGKRERKREREIACVDDSARDVRMGT